MKNSRPATHADLELALAAASLVGQFASNNPMPPPALAGMLRTVHEALVDLVDNGKRADFANEISPPPAAPQLQLAHPAPKNPSPAEFNQASILSLKSPVKKKFGPPSETKNDFHPEFVAGPPSAEPFVPISSSVFTDRIVCLECGNAFSNITRHIKAYHGLTDRDYRLRYGLSAQYPFSCADYIDQRATLATKNSKTFRPLTKKEHAERKSKLKLVKSDDIQPPSSDSPPTDAGA